MNDDELFKILVSKALNVLIESNTITDDSEFAESLFLLYLQNEVNRELCSLLDKLET